MRGSQLPLFQVVVTTCLSTMPAETFLILSPDHDATAGLRGPVKKPHEIRLKIA
jgi:hypothetical protein